MNWPPPITSGKSWYRRAVCLAALLVGSAVARAVNYEVYPGSAFYLTQMVSSVSYPYTAQFANGFYFHPVGFGNNSDTVLTTAQKQQICNNFSNRFAMVEGDMGASNPNADLGDIGTMTSFGLTPIATFVNSPAVTPIWQQLVANNGALNTPSYEMTAPWGVAAKPGGWTNSYWNYLRSNLLVSGCSGIGIDSPVNLYRSGYTVGNPAYQQCVWQMVQYAQANGKRFNYLASPNSDTGQQFLLDLEYVAQTCEDNGAEPNVYGVELYGTEPVNLTPETTNYNGVAQANWTTTGLAYYLLKHRDGDPGTLDLYAASNGVNYAQNVMSPILTNAAQIIPFNPAQTNQFTLTLTNTSAWLDYAAVLRARAAQAANWNIAFKLGTTNITSSVLNTNGYGFLGGQRLLPNTAQQVTVTLAPIGAPTPLDLVIEALPHAGVDQALDVIAFQYQTNQSPPTLDFPTNNWFTRQGMATAPIWFTVGDAETISTNLTVTAVSSNPTLVPNANIVFGQSGVQRWVNLTPAANQWGVAPITISVSDGQFSVSNTFLVNVQQTNLLPFVKANNTVNLELTNSWVTNAVPGPYDQAIWNSTVTAANTVTLGAAGDWAGIQITSPGGPVTINGTNLLNLETAGVDASAASQNLTLNCPVVLNASATWNIAAGRVVTVSGSVTGYGVLTKSGLGTLTLSGTNSYSGGTTITSSYGATNALLASNSSTLGTGAVTIGGLGNSDGSCLQLAGGIMLTNVLTGWASRNVNSPNLLNVSGTNTVTSNLSGSSGGSQSTLESDSGNLLMLGGITTRQLNLQGAGSGELRGVVNIGANSLVMNGPGLWLLTATNIYTNSTTINGGTLQLGNGTTRNGSVAGNITDNAVLVLANPYAQTYGGSIMGAGTLTVIGSGAQTLSGVNSYTGATTISAGTLALSGSGSIGNSSVISVAGGAMFNVPASGFTVASGQTLTGAGLVTGGPVTVAGGGTLAPGQGAALGSLTISNLLTLGAGSTTWIQLNKSAQTNDSVRGLSSVSYGGTLQLTNLAGTLANGDAFKLFYAGSRAGAFAAISPPAPGAGLRWNTNTLAADGTLRITNAPVPRISKATPQNGGLVLGVANGSPGFAAYVQAATNLAGPQTWVSVSTNLFDGGGNLLMTNLVQPGVPATFFRIAAP